MSLYKYTGGGSHTRHEGEKGHVRYKHGDEIDLTADEAVKMTGRVVQLVVETVDVTTHSGSPEKLEIPNSPRPPRAKPTKKRPARKR